MRFSRYVNANRLGNRQVFLAHDPDNLLNRVIFYAWTACRVQICKTYSMEGDVSVPHYDINSCTLPWNFIVIRSQEAWTLSTPTAAPTYLERILRSNSGTGPVQYVLCEPTWPIKGSTTMKGWLGSRWAGNSVWSPPSIRETEKGTFNPVGSLRCHRQREMHSFSSFSQLFHEDWRNGGEGKNGGERSLTRGRWGWRKKELQLMLKKKKKWRENGEDMTDITGADRRLLEPLGTCSYAALRTLASCSFCARRSATVQNKRKHRFINIFWGPCACVSVCVCVQSPTVFTDGDD